jgi:plastocyanin
MKKPSRRRLLAATAGLSTVGVAGCLGGEGTPTAADSPDTEATPGFEVDQEGDYELPVDPNPDEFVDRRGQAVVEIETLWRKEQTPEFVFDPAFVRVDQGMTVRWVNGNGVFHSVTSTESLDDRSRSGAFDAQITSEGATFEWEAEGVGRQCYYCTPHARFMFGTVEVV